MSTARTVRTLNPLDPIGLNDSLSTDERAVRDTIRAFCAKRVLAHIGEW